MVFNDVTEKTSKKLPKNFQKTSNKLPKNFITLEVVVEVFWKFPKNFQIVIGSCHCGSFVEISNKVPIVYWKFCGSFVEISNKVAMPHWTFCGSFLEISTKLPMLMWNVCGSLL